MLRSRKIPFFRTWYRKPREKEREREGELTNNGVGLVFFFSPPRFFQRYFRAGRSFVSGKPIVSLFFFFLPCQKNESPFLCFFPFFLTRLFSVSFSFLFFQISDFNRILLSKTSWWRRRALSPFPSLLLPYYCYPPPKLYVHTLSYSHCHTHTHTVILTLTLTLTHGDKFTGGKKEETTEKGAFCSMHFILQSPLLERKKGKS